VLPKRIVTDRLPAASAPVAASSTLAVPPAAVAGCREVSETPGGGSAAKATRSTTPDGSVACNGNDTVAPWARVSAAGHTALIGAVPVPQGARGAEVFRGCGVPVMKSAPLSSVSVHPPSLRNRAVPEFRPGAAVPSKALALP
jgi:hypothetical protein